MSLATLKAKTNQQKNISKNSFSLNGGRRNISYVGKNYCNHPICTYSSNDSSIIKNSTSNNSSLTNTNKMSQIVNTTAGSTYSGIGPGSKDSSEYIYSKKSECVEEITVGNQTCGEYTEEVKCRVSCEKKVTCEQ